LAEPTALPAPQVPQPIDGKSLVPVLKNAEARVRDHAFHVYPNARLGRSIRTERFRFVEWRRTDEKEEDAALELYDYELDPLETRNHASDLPEVVAELRQKLRQYPASVDPRANNRKPGVKSQP
jgi:iduronate 2-sulfatase